MKQDKRTGRKLLSFLLMLAMVIGLLPGMTMTAQADGGTSTYTVTIPSELTVSNKGWNKITGGIKAKGTLESGKVLTVTATSTTNSYKLKSGNDDTGIGYNLAKTGDNKSTYNVSAKVPTWGFTELKENEDTALTAGIIVEDYSTMPGGNYSDTVTFTASVATWNTVDLSTMTTNYEAKDYDVLTGTLSANVKISIADGATVKLNGVTINGTDDSGWAGITLAGDGTIILSGTNSVKGFHKEYPGIYVPSGKTLTIQGDGSLTASSNGSAAGIGAGYSANQSCGNIVITGGTIDASGGTLSTSLSAGIGGGRYGSCGTITITNTVTKVTATRGQGPASLVKYSIGPGASSSCGTVTIGCTLDADGNPVGGTVGAINKSPYTYQP